MKRTLSLCVLGCVLLASLLFAAVTLNAEALLAIQQQDMAAQNHAMNKPDGEEVFRANCARCHMPPMSLSPRTTGTVVMHMRVRARLSRQDEKLLLKYLAP